MSIFVFFVANSGIYMSHRVLYNRIIIKNVRLDLTEVIFYRGESSDETTD